MKTICLILVTIISLAIAGPIDLIQNCVPTNGSYYCNSGDIKVLISPGVASEDDASIVYWLMPFTFALKNNGKESVTIPVSSFYMKDDTGFSVDFLSRDEAQSIVHGSVKSGAGNTANIWTSALLGEAAANKSMKESGEKAAISLTKVPDKSILLRPGEKKMVLMVTPVLPSKATSFTVVFAPDSGTPVEMQFSKLTPIKDEKYSKTKQTMGCVCSDSKAGACLPSYDTGNKTTKLWGFKPKDMITSVSIDGTDTEVFTRNQLEILLRSAPNTANIKFTVLRDSQPITLALPEAVEDTSTKVTETTTTTDTKPDPSSTPQKTMTNTDFGG
jgi:hypothetical protein